MPIIGLLSKASFASPFQNINLGFKSSKKISFSPFTKKRIKKVVWATVDVLINFKNKPYIHGKHYW